MHDDRELVEARIRRQLRDHVVPAVYGGSVPLEVEAHHVPGEPITVDQARSARFEPFAVGSPWGTPWGTTWFRMSGQVPAGWSGAQVEALVDLGGGGGPGFTAEALVWGLDGPQEGIHPDKKTVLIAERSDGDEAVELLIEAAANPDFTTSFGPNPLGDPTTAPEVPLYRLSRADLVVRRSDVWQLVLDMKTLTRLMVELPLDEPRRHLVLRALERSFDILDLDDVPASAERARAELAEVLGQSAHASAHTISAAGHAHIDTAWLWPLRETKRKCARTFSNQIQLMDRYPEHVFVCSQAQQYAWMKEHHPELYVRIKAKVAAGQFVPTGSMWVEADTNIPSGESLVRQFVHGKRYFADEFGVETTDVWIPDVFGYCGQLPQIMSLAGCRWFLTQKLSWNDTNRFPHHTFRWEGIDGSRVFTHFPPAETYNGTFRANELIRAVKGFSEHGFANRSFYPFGHGDGGGGPTAEMLELARRQSDLEGLPRVDIEAPEAFFSKAHGEYPDAPVWRGELYFEMHRGTYTSQARTKWGNRRGEFLLREAELWSTVAARRVAGFVYPAEELDRWWKVLLLHQFHDIIPGSSIAWVHNDTERDHSALHEAAEVVIERALAALGGPDEVDDAGVDSAVVTLLNGAACERLELATVDSSLDPGGDQLFARIDSGAVGWVQRRRDGRLSFAVRVGATAATRVELVAELTETESSSLEAAPSVQVVPDRTLENDRLRVTVADDGTLGSVFHLDTGREVLAGSGNLLQLHDDRPNAYDAWDIDASYRRSAVDLLEVDSIEVIERGPVVASIRVVRTFGSSRIDQTYSLAAGASHVRIDTEVDWQESEKLLKAAFPLAVRSDEATYEIQFGHVRRPTHTNTSWDAARFEVCAHRWADLSESGFGASLLNNSKYGHDCVDNVLRLTLLKSASYPDPNADRGTHHFSYALRPHAGSFQEAGVIDEALAFNLALRAMGGRASLSSFATAGEGIAIEAVKLADDGSGDVVVRCYESHGRHVTTAVTVDGCTEAVVTDLLERGDERVDPAAIDFGPFQIRTLRFS